MLTDDEIYYLGSIQISDDLFAQKKIYALADEIKRLRAELAVFTEGMPTKVEIEQYMDIMNAMMKSEIARPRWHPVYTWLLRIAEVPDVD